LRSQDDEAGGRTCKQEQKEEQIALIGIDERLHRGPSMLLCDFFDHRFVDA
jgi:hypothetical protein